MVGAPARITFNTSAAGAVETLTFHQEGDHPGKRVAEQAQAAPDLNTYAGRYFSEELETFYDLTVKDGQLVINHRRFTAPLTRTDADTFAGTLPVSQVVFRHDGQGNLTGFEAGNGRARGIVFKRVNR